MTRAGIVPFGEEHLQFRNSGIQNGVQGAGGNFAIGFEQHLSRGGVNDIGGGETTFQIVGSHFHLGDLGLLDFLEGRRRNLSSGRHQRFMRAGVIDTLGDPVVNQSLGDFPEQLAVFERNLLDLVEGLDDFGIVLQSQRPQKNGGQEFALAVNPDVEKILGVVLKFHPRAAIRNDLPEEVSLLGIRLEKDSRRTVQLADDNAFGPVDDKRPVFRHQGNFTEVNFLFFDVADALVAGIAVLVVEGEADRNFKGRRESHAALLAFGHVVLQLERHRVTALVTERHHVLVEGAALGAEDLAHLEGIGNDRVPAVLAGAAQVVEPLQASAFALPIADGVIHKVQLRDAAEIRDGEDGIKDGLQPHILPFRGQKVHLEEALVGAPLDLDEIRNLNDRRNFGEINTLTHSAVPAVRHSFCSLLEISKVVRTMVTQIP